MAGVVALAAPLDAAAAEPTHAIGLAQAREILFSADKRSVAEERCGTGAEREQIACFVALRFAEDAKAAKLAVDLYERTGTVAGTLPEQDFDGAYRGRLHLVPKLPVGPHRRHLEWAAAALLELDDFFADLQRDAPVNYRWKPLDLRFFESVKRRTPSAWASGWEVAYNVSGSLFGSAAGVRETMFHEVFHLNDFARGQWSQRALADVYGRIVARCGTRIGCLAPYAPDPIIVRGGTYYAFMPDNGVAEYAADLAKRYYVEHRALMRKQKLPGRPFKCLAPENAEAWRRVSQEFFGGVDRVPACEGG
ncbi:MAG: hypothetical protein HY901_28000 [Deltaproteobacteria bacterium]|nr:hypothetical protein [Deltaproteobacteria bacterium]